MIIHCVAHQGHECSEIIPHFHIKVPSRRKVDISRHPLSPNKIHKRISKVCWKHFKDLVSIHNAKLMEKSKTLFSYVNSNIDRWNDVNIVDIPLSQFPA